MNDLIPGRPDLTHSQKEMEVIRAAYELDQLNRDGWTLDLLGWFLRTIHRQHPTDD